MVGAKAQNQLFFRIEPLATHAVIPFIRAEINITCIVNLLQNVANGLDMIGIGCADEIIVSDGKLGPQAAELGTDGISVLLGADAGFHGGFCNFVTVLVGAGDKKSFSSRHAGVSGQHIGDDSGISVTNVRRRIDIINRCGDVIGFGHDDLFGSLINWRTVFCSPADDEFWVWAALPDAVAVFAVESAAVRPVL